MTSLSLREEFCWNRSNSYNLLTETRRVIKNMQTSAITKQTNINKKQTFNWLRHCKAACRGRPAILTAQLSKPCISWLPNLKSTGCQCFPDISNLLQDSYHASGASVFVHCISHQQVVQQYSCGGAVDTIPAPNLPRHQQNWLPCHCSWAAWWRTPTGSCHFDRRHQWPIFFFWHLWHRSHSSFYCLSTSLTRNIKFSCCQSPPHSSPPCSRAK